MTKRSAIVIAAALSASLLAGMVGASTQILAARGITKAPVVIVQQTQPVAGVPAPAPAAEPAEID